MIPAAIFILIAQVTAPQRPTALSTFEAERWRLEHARDLEEAEKARQHAIQAIAAQQREACRAVSESLAMHLRIWEAYTADGTVNLNTPREEKALKPLLRRFKSCIH